MLLKIFLLCDSDTVYNLNCITGNACHFRNIRLHHRKHTAIYIFKTAHTVEYISQSLSSSSSHFLRLYFIYSWQAKVSFNFVFFHSCVSLEISSAESKAGSKLHGVGIIDGIQLGRWCFDPELGDTGCWFFWIESLYGSDLKRVRLSTDRHLSGDTLARIRKLKKIRLEWSDCM